jgi:hypothetical protein
MQDALRVPPEQEAGVSWVEVARAGQDLVGGIDHGLGSNQPVHHLRMAESRRSAKRSLAVLRCEARQEVKREPRCCLCQAEHG